MENVDRKEVVYLFFRYGFWVIRLRKGIEYRVGIDEYSFLFLIVFSYRVGIFLDYEVYDIFFYNVIDGVFYIFIFFRYFFLGRFLFYFSFCYSIDINNIILFIICILGGEG